jgi:hypothetical protein
MEQIQIRKGTDPHHALSKSIKQIFHFITKSSKNFKTQKTITITLEEKD